MSLKHFHLLFILLSVIFSLLFGAWALLAREQTQEIRGLGVFSVAMGVGLLAYGVYFLRKSRRIIT
ncbi:MAG: hypothetical protein KDM63_01365 [Verrucomicrobiae bacterium]|nr:hypothetical protein [Verrucomicrobiae bacterium]MCB1085668.1 hypothetical protein [Verrucomicrobiae bacterium]MCB1089987.1 hypothetical protein [Verrucomicrobiae bacterium]